MKKPRKPRKPRAIMPKGFLCPHCGVLLDTISTRKRSKSIVVRRRACPICNHRVTTEERPKVA